MKHLKQKVSYLKGLTEGLKFDPDSKEGKILSNIIDVLDEFADAIDDLNQAQNEISEYIELIDEDLSYLEDNYYEKKDDLEEEYYEVQCPNCKDTIVIEEEFLMDDNKIICPNCNHEIEINLSEECEGSCNK